MLLLHCRGGGSEQAEQAEQTVGLPLRQNCQELGRLGKLWELRKVREVRGRTRGSGADTGVQTPGDYLAALIQRMLRWLGVMCHPDGQIVLFNDAACGIVPHPEKLFAYARRLGIDERAARDGQRGRWLPLTQMSSDCMMLTTHLASSGYVRLDDGPATFFLDVAPLGPDYLPGHGHADTLTFEMSLGGQRVIVDMGTSL